MSINIQLDGKLQKISGQTMTKEKIVEKLGYTPANEATVNTTITNLESTIDADIAAVNADLSELKTALENYIKDHPDIVEDGSGEVVFTDEAGNIIAKLDADGLHTTNIEADSFISGDDSLIINDPDGNKIFQVDKDGVETTKLKLASGDVDEQLDSLAADIAAVEAKIPEIPVKSVNGKTGDVELEYSDLNNAPAIEAEENEKSLIITDNNGNIVLKAGHLDEADDKITGIETTEVFLPGGKVDERISVLTADLAAHAGNTTNHITDTERNTWNNKSDFSGEFKELINSPIEEDNSGELVYTDESGNIALKIGKLDENTTGLETIEIKLKSGKVDERIENITADLSEHKNNTDIHITKEERADWNAKATTQYVDESVAGIVDSAPATLNTLKELSTALGNDENFATTVAGQIGEKAAQTDFVAHRDDKDVHITPEERTAWNNKSEFSGNYTDLNGAPDITTDEDDSLLITDEAGNIVFKAGELAENITGIETTTIKAKSADIDNIYDKSTVDAKLAALEEAKSDEGHSHTISASAEDDDVVILEGTSGTNGVSYKATHAAPIANAATDRVYTKVSVDAKGHITSGSAPTNIADLGITDVYTEAEADAKIAEHANAATAHTKAQVGLGNVDNTSDLDKPISTATQAALNTLKEEIVTESDSWTVADKDGNILLKAGELEEGVTGLETTTIIAETAKINNLYNRSEVDAIIAGKTYSITANSEDDDIVVLEGTSGENAVTYKATHANSGVAAGTYRSITVDAKGHVTAGTNPSTLEGYGLENDAYTKVEVNAKIAEHANAETAHTKAQIGLANVDNTSDADKPISTATQTALDALKEEIVTESDSWTIVDETGNILLKAGELDDGTIGLETTTIKAQTADISNIYNKTEVDAVIAATTYNITANAEDDNVVNLEGTSGANKVTYKATHADSGVTAGTYKSVTVNAKGHITGGTNPDTLEDFGITDAYTKVEINALLAEKSDGDHDHTITAGAEDDDVVILEGTSGTNGVNYRASHATPVANEATDKVYTKVSVDAKGHITSGSKPTTLAGYEISDAYTKEEIDAAVAAIEAEVANAKLESANRDAVILAEMQSQDEALKTELSESIVSESNSWSIVDESGNIMLEAGEVELDNGTPKIGLKTTAIIADEAIIDNIYDKTTIDAKLASLDEAKSDKSHVHKISGTVTKEIGGIKKDTEYVDASIMDVLSELLFPYVAPVFSSISTSASSGTFEYGTTRVISTVTPNFTKGSKDITSVKIGTTDGGSDLYSGTSATSGSAITLTTSKTFDGNTGGTIYCTLSDGTTPVSKSTTVSYKYYEYSKLTTSTTADTTGATKQSNSSADNTYNYSSGQYLWLYSRSAGKKIQTYVAGSWADVTTTATDAITLTLASGATATYYAYRTDQFTATGSARYRLA